MEIFNRTDFSLEQIKQLPLRKIVRNEWRQREISLYDHPTLSEKIISVGRSYDHKHIVVAIETEEDWRRELENPKFVITTQ